MTDSDFITELFCRVDDRMKDVPKHSQAKMYPSELVTLGILFALKGSGCRAFYRWVSRNFSDLFPKLLQRTRFFRALKRQRICLSRFCAEPSMIGLIDSFGIKLIHPRREGRSSRQIGRKGYSNQRWIVGGKLCVLLNHLGLVVAWDCDSANVYDGSAFQGLVDGVADQMVVFERLSHRVWDYFQMRLDYVMAMFNILAQWDGLKADENGFVHLSIAKFSL